MAGWGGIVSGTAPSLMYKGYQDAQTQELGQQRAGLVNQGLQSEIEQQKANEPLVKAERGLKMEGLEEQKNYNAFMRDFLPVAKRAVATQNPQVVADMLSYEGYIPDGRKYKGGVKVDQRTGAKAFTLTDDAGNTQEFGSINEMLEVPMALANPKNFMGWLEESRKSRAKTSDWMREKAWDVRKMGMERANKLEEMDYGSGLKREEATHQGSIDVQKARLTPTPEEKNTMMYVESLGVDPVQANMIMHSVSRGDDAAYQRAVLAAAGNIFQNSFDTESAQKKVDGLKAYADKLRKSSLWGGGGGGAGGEGDGTGGAGAGGGAGGAAGQAIPGDPQSVYDQIRSKYPNKSEAEIKKAAEAISQRLSQGGGGAAGAGATGSAGSASPSKGGGLSPSKQRTIQELDQIETTIPNQNMIRKPIPRPQGQPGQGQQGQPAQPGQPGQQQVQGRGLADTILSALSPSTAYAGELQAQQQPQQQFLSMGTEIGAAGTSPNASLPMFSERANRFLLQGGGGEANGDGQNVSGVNGNAARRPVWGEGAASGLMMSQYAPEAWLGMSPEEQSRYETERPSEISRWQGGGNGGGGGNAGGGGLQSNVIRQPIPQAQPVQSNVIRQPMPSPVQSNIVRQPMPSPVQSNVIRRPIPQATTASPSPSQPRQQSQQQVSPQQSGQRPITDKWGDQVIPGRGTPVLWHELPTRDRAEDVQQVVSGERSMGEKKDRAIFEAYALANEDPALAAEVLAMGMKVGKIPPIFMWPSDNTALPEYHRGGAGGGLAD